jgi:hypothetical protein
MPADERLFNIDATSAEILEDIKSMAPQLSSDNPAIRAFL